MTTNLQTFLSAGCGRCSLFNTPQCKIHKWRDTVEALRAVISSSSLKEEMKWGFPTYTLEGKNVLMIGVFKAYTVLSFFKGSLLTQHLDLLQKAGENSHIAKIVVFRSVNEVLANEFALLSLIKEAIDLEVNNIKPISSSPALAFPLELTQAFEQDADFQNAFLSLSAGKQRGYLLHFTGAKQSATRTSRIEAKKEAILRGEGMQDAYKAKK